MESLNTVNSFHSSEFTARIQAVIEGLKDHQRTYAYIRFARELLSEQRPESELEKNVSDLEEILAEYRCFAFRDAVTAAIVSSMTREQILAESLSENVYAFACRWWCALDYVESEPWFSEVDEIVSKHKIDLLR